MLADVFAAAIYGYAVMSNHLHVVLHIDPHASSSWDDDEVARRWCALFPVASDDPAAHHQQRVSLAANPARIAIFRSRLGSLSWFMRCLNEPIARRANREDDCTGRFWEGRYKCQALLDERAVLAAMAYVDLNPIRAGMTDRLDQSRHTSIARRIGQAQQDAGVETTRLEPVAGRTSVERLSIRTSDYLELVDWTGRQWRPGKVGVIAASEPGVLARLGIEPGHWTTQVREVGSGYWRAIGSVNALLERASAMGQRWLKGLGLASAVQPV